MYGDTAVRKEVVEAATGEELDTQERVVVDGQDEQPNPRRSGGRRQVERSSRSRVGDGDGIGGQPSERESVDRQRVLSVLAVGLELPRRGAVAHHVEVTGVRLGAFVTAVRQTEAVADLVLDEIEQGH